ncbi:MAG: L-aspartate oxidase [Verrucomicrobiae bacterium]|nr:L-aspartate oxidase [Verrucomicrobiae bacterium]
MPADSFDILVVGSGIAGLRFALKTADFGHRVAIITKKEQAESNTNYAQGGIAVVTSTTDDFDLHVKDTLIAGDGLCNEEVVRQIVEEGPARVKELIELGLKFTRLDNASFSLGKEGGHSKRRIMHVADMTGKAIEAALVQAVNEHPNITTFEHAFVIDLITLKKLNRIPEDADLSEDQVVGVYVLDVLKGGVRTLSANVVMLASGGAGHIYPFTSNPSIATGDGIAMAYRVGVPVQNMEFIQFHPTTLYSDSSKRFLISEAVRGEGALLRDMHGERFMDRYDERAELAPRDIVARAIDAEMKKSGSAHLWLDITHKDEAFLKDRFPSIYEVCLQQGINIAKDWMPVVPAAHYLCGGVETNLRAETGLPGLYACGEVACTGLHGANRLASNSLLEALVMAYNGAEAVDRFLSSKQFEPPILPHWVDGEMSDPDERVVITHNWEELQRAMWDYVGIVRSSKRLERALKRIDLLASEINDYYWNFKVEPLLLELRNLVLVGELIVRCAMQRKESRGLHYTLDYPDQLGKAEVTRLKKGA